MLTILWITWSAMHSILAMDTVKKRIMAFSSTLDRYYRLLYSCVATISLAIVLYFQFSLDSELLWTDQTVRLLSSLPFLLMGIVIMGISIRKYFYELSGIQALSKEKDEQKITLQKQGLHKFIRHPLYLGTLLFVWGLFMLVPSNNNLIACMVITLYVLIGIRLEEKKLIQEFGNDYKNYQQSVPMLIPRLGRGSIK